MLSYCGSRAAYLASRNPPTSASFCAIGAAQSVSRAVAALPAKRDAALAWCSASAARIRVFDGTQPILTQVPPMVPAPISATSAPSSLARIAAENPADPAPITTRSGVERRFDDTAQQ